MTPSAQKHYKATNSVTGESVEFQWSGAKPPTQSDVDKISDQQRQARINMKQQQVDEESKRPFMDKLLMSKPVGAAMDFARNFEWHPVQGAEDLAHGVSQMVTGNGPQQNPRLAGGVQAARGAMGIVGPPLLAAGMLTAPELTGPAMAGSTVGGPAAQSLVPPDWSPEAKEGAGMAGSLIGGALAGSVAGRTFTPSGPPTPAMPPEEAPMTGEVMRVPQPVKRPQTGVNYNEPPRFSQQQLPPGTLRPQEPGPAGLRPGPTVQPSSGETIVPPQAAAPEASPAQQLPPGTPQPQLAGQRSMAELPRGPIQMGPTAPTQLGPVAPPLGYSPSGSFDEGQAPGPKNIPPPQQGPLALPPPSAIQMGPVAPPTDLTRRFQVGGTMDEPQAPLPSKPMPPETPSAAQASPAKPLSVSDVSSVSTPAPQAPPMLPPTPTPAPLPPVQPPAPPQVPPAAPQTAQTPAPPVQPAPAPSSMSPAIKPPQAAIQALQTPAPVKPPVQAAPPQVPGPVANPTDWNAIVNNALEQDKSSEAEQLPAAKQASAQANNDVLQMLKLRKNVTPSQIANKLGLSSVDTKAVLQSLEKRGLITRKGSTYNYNRLPNEEIETPAAEESPQSLPKTEEEAPVSEARQSRMSDLQKMVGQAEDEGDDYQADVLRGHLKIEERAAEIERKGTPEQKAALKQRDDLTVQAQQLEAKEDAGKELTPDEKRNLGQLYKKINALEVQDFFRSEEGSSPSVEKRPGDDLNRSFFSRWAYSMKNAVNPPEFADIRALSAELGSPNRVLRDSGIAGAVEIGHETPNIEVQKYKWLGTTLREDAAALSHLTDDELQQVARALDVPGAELEDLKQSQLPPKIKTAAIYLRNALDKTFDLFPEKVKKSGGDARYLSGYLPHIVKQFGDDSYFSNAVNDAAQYFLGTGKGIADILTRTPISDPGLGNEPEGRANIQNQGINTPKDPYLETRTGKLTDYTLDLKRILPMYRKLAAKVIFDKPWIDEARGLITKIPEDAPKARGLAEAYLRNYADTPDGYHAVRTAWDHFTGPIMRAHARSLLGLSSRLFSLHGARLMSQIFPEVPTKYFAQGIAKTLANPIDTYVDLGRRGVLPANVVPWFFERPFAKVDRALQAFSTFDYVPDAVGWHALNNMYLDQGFDSVTAGNMASNKIMDLSMRSTPARMQKLFHQSGPLKPLLQYKQQIMKIAEQYLTQPVDAMSRGDYARLMRYLIGVGATYELGKHLGLITSHMAFQNLINFGGGAYGSLYSILKKGVKDPGGALEDLVLKFGMPAGNEIKGLVTGKGPSVLEKPDSGSPNTSPSSPSRIQTHRSGATPLRSRLH